MQSLSLLKGSYKPRIQCTRLRVKLRGTAILVGARKFLLKGVSACETFTLDYHVFKESAPLRFYDYPFHRFKCLISFLGHLTIKLI